MAGYPRALASLERFITRTARPAPGYHLMAQIYAHQGERDRALLFARKAVEGDPANGVYWGYLGQIYHGMGGPRALPAALRCYTEALRRRPEDGSLWLNLGRAYASGHQWADAVRAFERARAADPGNGEIHYHLGHALQAVGRPEEARRELAAYRAHRDTMRREKRPPGGAP